MDLDLAVKVNALIVEYLVYGTAKEIDIVRKHIKSHFESWQLKNPDKVCGPSNNWLAKYLDTERVFLGGTQHERSGRAADIIDEIASSVGSSVASPVASSS